MPHDDCWFCTRPLTQIRAAFWQTVCTCRAELQYHNLRHPHALPLLDCTAFLCQDVPGPQGDLFTPTAAPTGTDEEG